MTRNETRRSAFTLIELLVVVAILALLMTILLPYLTRARGVARRAICMQNQRTIGNGIMGFASAHNGRGPGSACYVNDTSVAWQYIMMAEWFKGAGGGFYVQMGQSPVRPTNGLLCPDWKFWIDPIGGSSYCTRVMQYSEDAAGGASPNWDYNYPPGPPALVVDTKYINYLYPPRSGKPITWYVLGSSLDRFKRPSIAYMLIETEYGNDTFHNVVDPTLYGASGVPAYAAVGRGLAFRHTLPADVSLYQTQATGIFVYMDGHVTYQGAVRPEIMDAAHWQLTANNGG